MFYWYFWIAAQIILEMFPISSSGHLVLLELLLKKYAAFDIKKYFNQESILQSIYYFLHGPTLIIVCGYFFSRWWQLIFTPNGISWHLILFLMSADSITIFLYILFKKNPIKMPLGLGFIITTLALFSTILCNGTRSAALFTISDAIVLGFIQGLALLPGISRLAFTCSVGCWLGFSLFDAFFISWTIQVPLMAAAFLKSSKDLYNKRALRQILNLPLCLVMLVSSGISIIMMSLMISIARNTMLYLFGFYMFIPLIIYFSLLATHYERRQ